MSEELRAKPKKKYTYEQYLKDIQNIPLRLRIRIKLFSLYIKFKAKIGLCSHNFTIGTLSEKKHKCICGKEVDNPHLKKASLKDKRNVSRAPKV